TLVGGNLFYYDNPVDYNNDGFTDFALNKKAVLFTKTKIKGWKIFSKGYWEDRWGGQTNWSEEYRGGDSIYAESVITRRVETIVSNNFQLKASKYSFTASFSSHFQDAAYGTTLLKARETIGFSQFMRYKRYGIHQTLGGITLKIQDYTDNTPVKFQNRTSFIPGIFFQDKIDFSERNTSQLGMRLDYHSFHGLIFSPRINHKVQFNNRLSLRLNAGTGFRVVNVFTEDHAALTGARNVIIKESLKPEKSYNFSMLLEQFTELPQGFLKFSFSPFYTLLYQ
ncbi:MAG: TonB-dependent receptor, partial [Bacteroidetes bacterium]